MEATWSSCWTVTSTCPGVWESVCLWTLPAGFTTCTARASSTGTSPPRYSVLVLLHALRWPVSHFCFHGEHWNSPSSLRCWVIQKIETVIMSPCLHVFWWPHSVQNCLVRCENGTFTAVVGDFGLAEKIPDYRSVWWDVPSSLSQPPWKNYIDKAWCHSDVIQPENAVSCSAATRLGSFCKGSVHSSPPCCKS